MATPHFEMPSGNDLKPNFLTNSLAGVRTYFFKWNSKVIRVTLNYVLKMTTFLMCVLTYTP